MRKNTAEPTTEYVLENFDKDDVIRTLFVMECEKLDADPDGMLLLFQLEFVKKCREERLKAGD